MSKDLNKRLWAYAMFDGHLCYMGGSTNACLVINMLAEHQDYFEKVCKTFDEIPLGYNLSEPAIYQKDGYSRKQQMRFQSKNHPILTKIQQRMYVNGKKVLDPHMLTLLDEEMLAIAFMADGSVYQDKRWANSKPQYRLHLNDWSYGDLMLLKKAIRDIFYLEVNARKKGLRFDLAVPTAQSEHFREIVKPFVLPSFQYKLG